MRHSSVFAHPSLVLLLTREGCSCGTRFGSRLPRQTGQSKFGTLSAFDLAATGPVEFDAKFGARSLQPGDAPAEVLIACGAQ